MVPLQEDTRTKTRKTWCFPDTTAIGTPEERIVGVGGNETETGAVDVLSSSSAVSSGSTDQRVIFFFFFSWIISLQISVLCSSFLPLIFFFSPFGCNSHTSVSVCIFCCQWKGRICFRIGHDAFFCAPYLLFLIELLPDSLRLLEISVSVEFRTTSPHHTCSLGIPPVNSCLSTFPPSPLSRLLGLEEISENGADLIPGVVRDPHVYPLVSLPSPVLSGLIQPVQGCGYANVDRWAVVISFVSFAI